MFTYEMPCVPIVAAATFHSATCSMPCTAWRQVCGIAFEADNTYYNLVLCFTGVYTEYIYIYMTPFVVLVVRRR